MLFLYLLSKSQSPPMTLASGFVLGLTFAFKPNIVFVILILGICWILNRRFKRLVLVGVGAAAGVTGVIFTAVAFFGSIHCWPNWLGRLGTFANHAIYTRDNYAITRLVWEFYRIKISPVLVVVFLCMVFVVLWQSRRRQTDNQRTSFDGNLLMISLGLLVYLLSGPVAWEHYFIYAVPVILIVFKPCDCSGEFSRKELMIQRLLTVLAFAGMSINSIAAVSNNVAATFINTGTLILFAIALRRLSQLRKAVVTTQQ